MLVSGPALSIASSLIFFCVCFVILLFLLERHAFCKTILARHSDLTQSNLTWSLDTGLRAASAGQIGHTTSPRLMLMARTATFDAIANNKTRCGTSLAVLGHRTGYKTKKIISKTGPGVNYTWHTSLEAHGYIIIHQCERQIHGGV